MRIKLVLALMALILSIDSVNAATYEYQVRTIVFRNLVAKLYLPEADGKVPVVIAFGGSDGGMQFGDANGEMIAPHGIAVLAVAYFKVEGLPPTFDHIPVEYFVSAVDFLETEPAVDATRIGLVSGSRGSEGAFLLASMDARIKSVVVTTPSKVAWYGMTSTRSAWTLHGKDVPALSLELDQNAPKRSRFEAALQNEDGAMKATFAFEKINGPIFLVSAKNDEIWPSYQMAVDIETYLSNRAFKYSVTHSSYPTGHAFSKETAPEIKQSIIDHFIRTLGTPRAKQQ